MMIHQFYAHMPIRKKFDWIISLVLGLMAIPIAVGLTGSIGAPPGLGQTALSLAALGSVALLLLKAKQLICDPYVSTVVRMEALAAGDIESPLAFTEHRDCVGRMNRSMLIFRDNAAERSRAEKVLNTVVSEITTGLEQMKSGNLAYRIERAFDADHDSLRTSFNDTTSRLGELLAQTASAASHVLTGATEIRSASDDLASRTEQQAASLEESAAAMREVTTMVQQTAQNAGEVGKQVEEAHAAADNGGAVVRRAVQAMDAIQKSSSQITNIIDVIDGIAFQTNLLALNAGVEAARAGDAGKGFAVVANEVRALAQRSADAAKDIKELITASTTGVSDGVALVDETGAVLLQISDRVAAINTRISEISTSAQAQAARLQQVNIAVGEMDKMTQQNAAMVEETNAAARTLAGEATNLSQVVDQFNAGQKSGAPPISRATPRPAPAARAPMVTGNLALKADAEDWSEF